MSSYPPYTRRNRCATCGSSGADRSPQSDDHGPTMEELDAMISERYATMPMNDELPPSKPEKPTQREAKADKLDRSFAKWMVPPEEWELTEDTRPAAISATQNAVVRDAIRELGPDASVEQISERAVLPVWNVKRFLESLARAET